jgi:pyruvate formate lyase activating enzyme
VKKQTGETTGVIFDIQRFSVHDGPGIRTTVFLHGCPLRCLWCHNPEALVPAGSVLFDRQRCIRCGKCVEVCGPGALRLGEEHVELDRDRCTLCGLCAGVCPSGALSLVGREVSVKEVLEVIRKDRPYYEYSGGGLTVSGGEPLLQGEFTQELLQSAGEEGIHTVVDTSGYGKREILASIVPLTDLFLFDIKHADPLEHKHLTGVEIETIIDNLLYLDEQARDIWVRIPVVPGCNDTPEVMQAIIEMIGELDTISRIELLPYHTLGNVKREQLGMEKSLVGVESPTTEQLSMLVQSIKSIWPGEVIYRR